MRLSARSHKVFCTRFPGQRYRRRGRRRARRRRTRSSTNSAAAFVFEQPAPCRRQSRTSARNSFPARSTDHCSLIMLTPSSRDRQHEDFAGRGRHPPRADGAFAIRDRACPGDAPRRSPGGLDPAGTKSATWRSRRHLPRRRRPKRITASNARAKGPCVWSETERAEHAKHRRLQKPPTCSDAVTRQLGGGLRRLADGDLSPSDRPPLVIWLTKRASGFSDSLELDDQAPSAAMPARSMPALAIRNSADNL